MTDEPKPLTGVELDDIERDAREAIRQQDPYGGASDTAVLRLVAEVQRLRDRVLELEDDVHSDRGAGGPAPGHPPDCRHCRLY